MGAITRLLRIGSLRSLIFGLLLASALTACSGIGPLPPGTPTPVPPPPATYQPSFPIRAAFFYPWFPNAWNQGGVYPFANYTPSLGYYSSTDDRIVDEQLRLAASAHLDAFISSWWGQGDSTDTALQKILARSSRAGSPDPNLRWAVYYEAESLGDPTVDQLVADLSYLKRQVMISPAYLRVSGKPVVFVYADSADGAGMADRWAQAKARLAGDLYTVLKVYPGYGNDPNQPDSWHQYAPSVGYDAQTPYSVSVSPGFWKSGEAPRLPRDPGRFESDVRRMVATNASWQLVTTWNEAGEGSGVEPTASFGVSYVRTLCQVFGGQGCDSIATASFAPSTPQAGTGSPSASGTVRNPQAASAARTPSARPSATPRPSTPTPTPQTVPAPTAVVAPAPSSATYPTPAGGNPPPATTTSSSSESVTIAAVGDIACGSDSGSAACRQNDVASLLTRLNPAAILTLGDTQYEKGAYQDFLDFFDRAFGPLKSRIRPVAGNHEYLTKAASGYFDYFDGIGQFSGPAGDRDKGYYTLQLGSWRLYALNSNCKQVGGCGAGSPQERWLRAELDAHQSQCSLMYMHHPLWSSDRREYESPELLPLYKVFYEHGGELSLVGHSHYYERFAPQSPNGTLDPTNGIRQIVVGTGGRNVYGFGPIRPNSEVRDGKTFGVLQLDLKPGSYDWRFISIDGQTFADSGSQACH